MQRFTSSSKEKEEEKAKFLKKVEDHFQNYLQKQYNDIAFTSAMLVTVSHQGLYLSSQVGSKLQKLHFLSTMKYFNRLVTLLTNHSSRNDSNGIVFKAPFGMKAVAELLGIPSYGELAATLKYYNFEHHEHNPTLVGPSTNALQDICFYHKDFYHNANMALVQLMNAPNKNESMPMPRRQLDAGVIDFRNLDEGFDFSNDNANAAANYEEALRILKHLRDIVRDEAAIYDSLVRFKDDNSGDYQKVIQILFYAVGLANPPKTSKREKTLQLLASKLANGNDFVGVDDFFVRNTGGQVNQHINNGTTRYYAAIAMNKEQYFNTGDGLTLSEKRKALKLLRNEIISHLKAEGGRFIKDCNGELQEVTEDELHKKLGFNLIASKLKREKSAEK